MKNRYLGTVVYVFLIGILGQLVYERSRFPDINTLEEYKNIYKLFVALIFSFIVSFIFERFIFQRADVKSLDIKRVLKYSTPVFLILLVLWPTISQYIAGDTYLLLSFKTYFLSLLFIVYSIYVYKKL